MEGEGDLVPIARAFFGRMLGCDQNHILEEVPSPWGRPDLIVFESKGFSWEDPSKDLSRPAISLILMLQREGPMGLEELTRRLGMTKPSVKRFLRQLLSRGLIQAQGGRLFPKEEAEGSLDRISSIEIKVCNWRSGLRQAQRYKTFSDEVYLFLGRGTQRINFSDFRQRGVGLVIMKPEPIIAIEPALIRSENVRLSRRLVEETIRKRIVGD